MRVSIFLTLSLIAICGCAGQQVDPHMADAEATSRKKAVSSKLSTGDANTQVANSLPDFAPTPYTADQIRLAHKVGSWKKYKMTSGERVQFQKTLVKEANMEDVVFEFSLFDKEGSPKGAPSSVTAKWEELRKHALFPKADTVISESKIETACGTFDCLHYQVTANGVVSDFYFAKDMPGAPIKYGASMQTEKGETKQFEQVLVEMGEAEK